jgi:hypothetical protein
VYAATLAMLPPGGLWIIDNGNKRIQVEALLASGFRDFSLPWPGRELDPDFQFTPMPNSFGLVREDRLYSVFSPVFPVLSALPFAALGERGLTLLPFLASLLLLAGVAHLARLAGMQSPGLAVLAAGLATPIWFYALVFWEHVVAASVCVGAVALVFDFLAQGGRLKVFLAGLALAIGAGLRDPLLLFAAVLGVFLFFAAASQRVRTGLVFGAGLAAGLLPLAALQWLALGDPLGFHLTHGFAPRAGEQTGLGAHLAARPRVLHHLLLAAAPGRLASALLTGPFALLLLLRPRLAGGAHRAVLVGAALWALAGALVIGAGYARAESPIEHLLRANGLFAAAPLLAAGLIRRRGKASAGETVRGRLLGLVLAYALLYTALTPLRNSTGIHWGNRYLLELYPLLVVPAAAALEDNWRSPQRRRVEALLLVLLVFASVAWQVFSLDLLRRKLVFGERLEAAVRERPERVIVTDLWWLPQSLPREFFEKAIFYTPDPQQRRGLLARAAERGDGAFLAVASAIQRPRIPEAQVIDDLGLRFFSVQLVPGNVPPGRTVQPRRSRRRRRRPIRPACSSSAWSWPCWRCSAAPASCCRSSPGWR